MGEMKYAYFAGGCFWCLAKPMHDLCGVSSVESGYCGSGKRPVYEEVKAQKTSFRETVRIAYDPLVISYRDLLSAYFYHIDPFDDGGQFIDRGRSYTCAVYFETEDEKATADTLIAKIEADYKKPVFVAVEPLISYYPAEEYHQDFAEKNPEAYEREEKISGRADRNDGDRVKL